MKKPKSKKGYIVYEKPIAGMICVHTNKKKIESRYFKFAEVEIKFVKWIPQKRP